MERYSFSYLTHQVTLSHKIRDLFTQNNYLNEKPYALLGTGTLFNHYTAKYNIVPFQVGL